MRPRTLVSALAVAVAAVAAAIPAPAWAGYPAGSVGHDVSYPQCTSSGATTTTVGALGGAFGVVDVTGGRPWGPNSCASAEFTWASGLPNSPSLYMNTANPAPTSGYYWPASGASDPALCSNAGSTTDPGCAYDYGWHAAADALGTEAKNIPNAATLTWWLDVETANSWNGNGTSNAADLQGAVDYLRSHGVPSVGLYSTAAMWSSITGGYSATTAASYASAWSPEFTAQFPMTSSPVWVAGVGNAAGASTNCGATFTGGQTLLAQYSDGSGYDADLACSAGDGSVQQSFALALSPTNGSVKRGSTATTTVTVSESGPAQTVSLSAGGVPAGVSASFRPASLSASGSSTLKLAVSRSAAPGTYPVTVAGAGSTGSTSATYTLTIR